MAAAFEAVMTASKSKEDGGMSVKYSSMNVRIAKEWLAYCRTFAVYFDQLWTASANRSKSNGASMIEDGSILPENVKAGEETGFAHRIEFSSGFNITILSSKADDIRSGQGLVIYDEAAMNDNIEEAVDSAGPLLGLGGRMIIISTVKGTTGEGAGFWNLCEQASEKKTWRLFETPIDVALSQGYIEHVVCSEDFELRKGLEAIDAELQSEEITKRQWTRRRKSFLKDTEIDWLAQQRESMTSEASFQQEYYCVPQLEGQSYFTRFEIRKCQREGLVHAQIEFKRDSDDISKFIASHVDPLIAAMPKGEYVMGSDYGATNDPTCIALARREGLKRGIVELVLEIKNMPGVEQIAVHKRIIESLQVKAGCMDSMGAGKTVYEEIHRKHGRAFRMCPNTGQWHDDAWPALLDSLERQRIEIPSSQLIAKDLQGVVEHPNGSIRIGQKSSASKLRHCDSAIALALVNQALGKPVSDMSWARRYKTRKTHKWT